MNHGAIRPSLGSSTAAPSCWRRQTIRPPPQRVPRPQTRTGARWGWEWRPQTRTRLPLGGTQER
eukprot:15435378-Alexandrium_andersonii.AAC.1